MMIRYGIPLLAAIALAMAVWSVRRMTPVQAAVDPPAPPPAAAFPNQIGAVGLVEAASENIAVSLPVPGLVTQVFVRAGDRVRRGQPLFALDDRDLRAELAVRESNLALVRARLARLEASPRPEEIPPARARVEEARAALGDAEVQLRLVESVKDPRAVKLEEVERRRRAVEQARARVAQAESALRLLLAGAWKADIEVLRAEADQAASQIARVQADLARLTVVAPIAGRVLQCKVRPGEYASTGQLAQPLILLGSAHPLHVRADIDEKDAWRFRPGAAAAASVRGNARGRFPLRFVRVEPYVVPKRNLTGGAAERVDTRVLQALFALPADAPVYPGQQMDVFVETKEAR